MNCPHYISKGKVIFQPCGDGIKLKADSKSCLIATPTNPL